MIKLADNIRTLRQSQNVTQEQLAEALEVSVGAVYKWESGRSVPSLPLILELAAYFGVSTDSLLGYTVGDSSITDIVARLQSACRSRIPKDGHEEAEKALLRYPNSFDVVYNSAQLYYHHGIDQRDDGMKKRALTLLGHACRLFDQNTDESISLLSIRIDMADLHMQLGEEDIALELLKKHNPCGINNPRIGCALASSCNKPDEAIPWLSKALLNSIVDQTNIVLGYVNVFVKSKQLHDALEILTWYDRFLAGLRIPGKPSFLDKTAAVFLTVRSELLLQLEQAESAKDCLRQARLIAREFDAAPNYMGDAVRYVSGVGLAAAHDDMGATAMDGIANLVARFADPGFTTLWEEVCHEII